MRITLSIIYLIKKSLMLFIAFFALIFSQDNRLRLKQANLLENITIDGESMQYLKGDVIFSATVVTGGDLISGIRDKGKSFESETYVLHLDSKTEEKIKNITQK